MISCASSWGWQVSGEAKVRNQTAFALTVSHIVPQLISHLVQLVLGFLFLLEETTWRVERSPLRHDFERYTDPLLSIALGEAGPVAIDQTTATYIT